ncbi:MULTISPECIES: hypothetical protein, partial [unclassified Shewanella]|uniref:hypothetical protein n=1 Tax=unclassified Shewanella TaxID=196818 RepID=UPI0035532D32
WVHICRTGRLTWMLFVMAELSGTSLLRVTVELAQKAAFSHPCDRDIPFILNIPAAGNGLNCSNGLLKKSQYKLSIKLVLVKRFCPKFVSFI